MITIAPGVIILASGTFTGSIFLVALLSLATIGLLHVAKQVITFFRK